MDAGALTLASPEVRFVLENESESPLDVQLYQLLESNALVEFMLLANITVGKRILRTFPTLALLRRHPAPTRQQFDALLSAAAAVGVELDIEDSKRLADSLDAATREADPYFNKLLRIAATRCMAPAQYFCSGERPQEEWNHYGLAAPIYTHFTSPIRRYADVVVHRLLAAAIGIAPLPATVASKSAQHEIAETINRRHRAAQLAGRASVTLHTLLYFKEHPTEEEAYILAIHAHKIDVMVPRFGIEGTIHLVARRAAGTAAVEHDPAQHRLTWTAGGAGQQCSVQVFDRVRVFIEVQARRSRAPKGTPRSSPAAGSSSPFARPRPAGSTGRRRRARSRRRGVPADPTRPRQKAPQNAVPRKITRVARRGRRVGEARDRAYREAAPPRATRAARAGRERECALARAVPAPRQGRRAAERPGQRPRRSASRSWWSHAVAHGSRAAH